MKTLIRISCSIMLLSELLFGQWVQQQTNLPVWTYPLSIDAVDENVCWAVAAKHPGIEPFLGFIKTTNGGEDWICDTIHTAEGTFNTICALDANTAYVSVKNTDVPGKIYKTTDGGDNWSEQNTAFTVINEAPLFIHFFDMNYGVSIGVKQGNYFEIFTTSDAGNNWIKVPETLMPMLSPDEDILCDDYASAGSSIWILTSGSRIFRSTDKGQSWISLNSPQSFTGCYPNIAFENENTGLLLANSDSPWKTINGGLDWLALPYNEDFSLRYICYVPGSAASYMLSSLYGSMYTLDCGNTYTIIDSSGHLDLDFSTPTTGWANGIQFGAIYKWAGQPLPVKESYKPVSEFALEQNYPNPFNPTTTIKFSIPKETPVNLSIYNILGEQVKELKNEVMKPGYYEVEFSAKGGSASGGNASQLASGVYFYRIKAGDPSTSSGQVFIQTKKMILLK